jgi:hypothetical protein
MFHFSRREFASLDNAQSTTQNTTEATSAAPDWAKANFSDQTTQTIALINIASACPYCVNYNLQTHHCDLYAEPIPESADAGNPCKGNTFSKRHYTGNRLAQLRAMRNH